MMAVLKYAIFAFLLTQYVIARELPPKPSALRSKFQPEIARERAPPPSQFDKYHANVFEETPPPLREAPASESTPPSLPREAAASETTPPPLHGPAFGNVPMQIKEIPNEHAAIAQPNYPDRALVCQVMTLIIGIARQQLQGQLNGNQFAVLAIIPASITTNNANQQIPALMADQRNYRTTVPTRAPNQQCRTHAEELAMTGLQQFYQNFLAAHPNDPPVFAVLFTWIHPCRDCTQQIIANLGFGQGLHPAFGNTPTYVGHTTQGNLLHPPLTNNDRNAISQLLYYYWIYLIHIPWPPLIEIALENDLLKNNTDAYIDEEMELCNTCLLGGGDVRKEFNCNREKGSSLADEIQQTGDGSCNQETFYFTTSTGKTCKSENDYHNNWCYTTDNSWDYICSGGQCGNHGNTDYDWCVSGTSWAYCNRHSLPYPDVTVKRDKCKSSPGYPSCGYYGESYAWCYTDTDWDYCCTSTCEQFGKDYDWCTTGKSWKYCKRDLPESTHTASGKTCKSGSTCGYNGQDYAWCYIDDNDNWDYCCTGECGNHGDSYDWCTSGNTWKKCKVEESELPYPTRTYNNKPCQYNQCGYHGQNYAWCYTGTSGITWPWDYCCTQECGMHGNNYDWCTTGTSSHWQYCQRESLPETKITAKGITCKYAHVCGYHGYGYSWCYTDSGYDYCCSSTCGKYGTDSNFCAAGNTWSKCIGNPYD